MLEESTELTEGMRWSSRVAKLFDQDDRWQVGALSLQTQEKQSACPVYGKCSS